MLLRWIEACLKSIYHRRTLIHGFIHISNFFVITNDTWTNCFYRRKQSLGQGNVFAPVCQSFCLKGVSASGSRGVCLWVWGCLPLGPGVCPHPSPVHPHPLDTHTHTVNKSAVRILLECFLLENCNYLRILYDRRSCLSVTHEFFHTSQRGRKGGSMNVFSFELKMVKQVCENVSPPPLQPFVDQSK